MRRLLVASAACAAPAALLAVAACVSGGRVTLNVADAADAGSAVDASAEAAPDVAEEFVVGDECGNAPYVKLGIIVVGLNLDDPDGSPLSGASFTSPLCPSLIQYSNDAGVIEGYVSRDVPFYGRLQAPEYVPELAPEESFDADSTGHKIEMLPTLVEGILLPGFDASAQTAIVVAAQKIDDDAGACSAFDGISFSVPGHPEAQVVYFSNDSIPSAVPDASATTAKGLAAITGLASGQLVTLAGTKPGCTILFQYDNLTGRVPLENGFVSLMPAYVSP